MVSAWQQGPLAAGPVGHFLSEQPLPPRLLFAEPVRRRMRVRLAGSPRATTSSSCASRARPSSPHGADRALDTDEALGRG